MIETSRNFAGGAWSDSNFPACTTHGESSAGTFCKCQAFYTRRRRDRLVYYLYSIELAQHSASCNVTFYALTCRCLLICTNCDSQSKHLAKWYLSPTIRDIKM